jgi:phosphinothricin acetyltransferase
MIYRDARREDLSGIFRIYDDEALHGTATFDTEASSEETRERWFERHSNGRYPAIVADADGVVAGWACLSPYSDRAAYARTAETSVYVDRAFRRRGVARELMHLLIARAPSLGIRVLLARITAERSESLALHRSLGFSELGTLRRAGEKFGRVLDVAFLDLDLERSGGA